MASPESDLSSERAYWNRRGYETRTEAVEVETSYPAADAAPMA